MYTPILSDDFNHVPKMHMILNHVQNHVQFWDMILNHVHFWDMIWDDGLACTGAWQTCRFHHGVLHIKSRLFGIIKVLFVAHLI
jgi:hypothetical protein